MQAAHNHIPLTINKSRPDAAAMLHPDLSFQLFRDIVISTYDSRVALIGPNAAPNARNDCMYHGCTEHLRNSLCGDAGWNISEARGVSSVVDPANHIRIACSTDGDPTSESKAIIPHLIERKALELALWAVLLTNTFLALNQDPHAIFRPSRHAFCTISSSALITRRLK